MKSTHASALQVKHSGLQRQIEQEMNRPSPDFVQIQALKKRKAQMTADVYYDALERLLLALAQKSAEINAVEKGL